MLLYGSGRNDGLFLRVAYEGKEEANALCLALCASKERRQETTELGRAFTMVVNESYQTVIPDGLAYPVAVGLAAQTLNLDLTLTLQSYLQAFAVNLISVGLRTIPIGQQAGQNCIVGLHYVIEEVMTQVAESSFEELGSAALMSDLLAMKHEHSIPRIYRT